MTYWKTYDFFLTSSVQAGPWVTQSFFKVVWEISWDKVECKANTLASSRVEDLKYEILISGVFRLNIYNVHVLYMVIKKSFEYCMISLKIC